MRRPSREISIFNLSMLDVICSALAAFLILFLLASKTAEQAASRADRTDKQMQALAGTVKEATEAMAELVKQKERAEDEAAACRGELDEEKQKRKANVVTGGGLAMGMCLVGVEQIEVKLWDHQAVDGDRVKLRWNDGVVHQDLSLTDTPAEFRLHADSGANYLYVQALSDGTSPPNTAVVVVNPCRDGKPELFEWNMNAGEERFVSIVRQ